MTQQIPSRGLGLARAATIVGGVAELARRLNVGERQLQYWIQDIGVPPDAMFFDAIDIIIEAAGTRRINDG